MSFVTSRSGRRIYLDGRPNEFLLSDIRAGLRHIYRFNAATLVPYPVECHTRWLAYELPALKRAALFHDAAEAFIGDITSPVRKLISGFDEIERTLQEQIFKQFGVSASDVKEVERLERGLYLRAEAETLLMDSEWARGIACDQTALQHAKGRLETFVRIYWQKRTALASW